MDQEPYIYIEDQCSEGSLLSSLVIFTKFSLIRLILLQISYSLVVILEPSGVSEVQYKEIMIIGNE